MLMQILYLFFLVMLTILIASFFSVKDTKLTTETVSDPAFNEEDIREIVLLFWQLPWYLHRPVKSDQDPTQTPWRWSRPPKESEFEQMSLTENFELTCTDHFIKKLYSHKVKFKKPIRLESIKIIENNKEKMKTLVYSRNMDGSLNCDQFLFAKEDDNLLLDDIQ